MTEDGHKIQWADQNAKSDPDEAPIQLGNYERLRPNRLSVFNASQCPTGLTNPIFSQKSKFPCVRPSSSKDQGLPDFSKYCLSPNEEDKTQPDTLTQENTFFGVQPKVGERINRSQQVPSGDQHLDSSSVSQSQMGKYPDIEIQQIDSDSGFVEPGPRSLDMFQSGVEMSDNGQEVFEGNRGQELETRSEPGASSSKRERQYLSYELMH